MAPQKRLDAPLQEGEGGGEFDRPAQAESFPAVRAHFNPIHVLTRGEGVGATVNPISQFRQPVRFL